MLLDGEADQQQVARMLGKLLAEIDDLLKRAFTYKSYQKNFKVSVFGSSS